jgi:hypothetical protein
MLWEILNICVTRNIEQSCDPGSNIFIDIMSLSYCLEFFHSILFISIFLNFVLMLDAMPLFMLTYFWKWPKILDFSYYFRIHKLGRVTFGRTIFDRTTFGRMTFSRTTNNIMTFSRQKSTERHSTVWCS